MAIGSLTAVDGQPHDLGGLNFSQSSSSILQSRDHPVVDLEDLITGLKAALSGRRILEHCLNLNPPPTGFNVLGPLQPYETAGMTLFGRLFPHDKSKPLGQRTQCVHCLDSQRRATVFAWLMLRYWWIARLVIEPGPRHPVLGEINLQAKPGKDCEPKDSVDGSTGKTQGIHPDELEGIVDPGLDSVKPRAPLKVESIDGGPEIDSVWRQSDLFGSLGRNE
jgi:hypothetical protein